MIEIISASKRHFQNFGWLQTYWLFSFDSYHDPANIRWGALRVFNDDIIAPHTGFDTHPHREMEIVTIVLRGEVSHRDSMGNSTVIKAGEVQRMSAGTGITHSEYNNTDHELHLYQIWILPERKGLTPSYEQKSFDSIAANELVPVVSGNNAPGSLHIHADATIYRLNMDAGNSLVHVISGRKVFIYIISGEISLDSDKLSQNDQARLSDEIDITIEAQTDASLILIEIGE